jgi:uncharacterized protein
MRSGATDLLRVNAAGILAKTETPETADLIIAALRADEAMRVLYVTAVASRVLGLSWAFATQLARGSGVAGSDAVVKLAEELRNPRDANGAIVSLIGAVEGCAISTMAADDYSKDIVTEYGEPTELTGTGEVKDGAVHVHVVLGRQGDEAKAGHLHWGKVEHFFVNAYVMPM